MPKVTVIVLSEERQRTNYLFTIYNKEFAYAHNWPKPTALITIKLWAASIDMNFSEHIYKKNLLTIF